MSFESILFQTPQLFAHIENQKAPDFFRDLNLDQLVNTITAPWKGYNIEPFFYTPLKDLNDIAYRQDVMQDLEDEKLVQAIGSFSNQMQQMRRCLAEGKERYYKYAIERHFIDAVEVYCEAVSLLAGELQAVSLSSQGLIGFRDYLSDYVASSRFEDLSAGAQQVRDALAEIRYTLLLRDGSVTVFHDAGGDDYSVLVERTFEKFRQSTVQDYRVKFRRQESMNHVEAQILDRVALLNPEAFQSLDVFCTANADYLDLIIARFDREIQFYAAYMTFVQELRSAGLSFCRPRLSKVSKEINCRDSFDLLLAHKLQGEHKKVVCNDFYLSRRERIFVISGPNQGGKTTFARMLGQLHYLASLGCPVPGRAAQLFLFDNIFAHFEREESIATQRGKLHDDLLRISHILDDATPNSIIILNEIFASTTFRDAEFLSREIMAKISELDCLTVWVTFIDELSSFNEKTVSAVSMVDPENPAIRTYKIERRPADGLAYALAIAEKNRVTHKWLSRRIES